MAQLQFRSDDTETWAEKFGTGADGALTISVDTTEAPIDSACSGTSGTTSLTATNVSFATGQIILIHQSRGTGAGNWELNVVSSYTAGTITTKYALTNTYGTGAQVRVATQNSSYTINSGKTLTLKAWDGTVGGLGFIVCNGDTTITGNISGSGKGFRGGANQGNTNLGIQGEGTGGAGSVSSAANGNGGGGGTPQNNDNGGSGSGGGNGAAGSNGSSGSGGNAVGAASLVTADFGGGGGSSASAIGAPGYAQAAGGNGGSFVLIISKTITVTGTLPNNGANGANGARNGGGGGAGGSTLLKGQSITLGSSLVTANAGAGGTTSPAGGTGSVGRIHADYLTSISGTTTPTLDSSQDTSLTSGGSSAMLMFFL